MSGIAALALAYVLSQFYRSFLAVLSPALIADLGVTKAELSTAAGVWFIAFALMQFPVGYALDRVGPKLTTAVLLVVAALGGLAFAFAGGAVSLIVAMGLIGAGCSSVLMASLFIFARVHAPRRFAMLASWFVAFGLAGNVLGSAPLADAAGAFGWRPVMVGLAAVTLVAAASLLAFVRDPPALPSAANSNMAAGGLMMLLKMPALWPLMCIAAVAYAPSANIRGLWAGPFLAEVHRLDIAGIGDATFLMSLALIAGSIVYGPLDVVFGTRKWVAFAGSGLTAASLAGLAVFGTQSGPAAVLFLVFAGFFGSNYSMIMAHGRAFMPPHLIGRGVTLMNFFSIGGAGLVQFLSGGVFDLAEARQPGAPAYQLLFAFYAGLLVLGLAAYFFSRDSHPAHAAR